MRTLLVFGEDWGRHPSSTQHLMPYLAEEFHVVWVNSIGLRRPSFSWTDLKRVWEKLLARTQQKQACDDVLDTPFTVIAAKVLPLPRSKFIRWLNAQLLKFQLRQELNTDREIWVWASLPSAIDFEGVFGETRWFYYCGDDFGGLAGVDHATVEKREQTLAQRADWIWTASETLKRKFTDLPISVLPHGVHVQRFAKPSNPLPSNPGQKKTLGFYGALAAWIDQALLVDLALQLPDWELELIGPALVDVSRLTQLPNVRLLPPQPHEALPEFIHRWDAAILPFIDNEQIRACNPLKLREYLASGTPVLSTPFPALSPYQSHVHIIEQVSETVAWLSALSETDTEQKRNARQACVANESWERRAQDVIERMKSIDAAVLPQSPRVRKTGGCLRSA